MVFIRKHVQAVFATVSLVLLSVLMLQSQGGNQRVDNFLNSLSTFSNADMARSALQNLRFTEAENRLLEGGPRKPNFAAQIDRLVKLTADDPTRPKPHHQGDGFSAAGKHFVARHAA
jgi:hypothetical protein